MNDISKVSQITVDNVAEYIRLDELTDEDEKTLKTLLTVSKSYIKSYTGLNDTEIDKHNDLVIAVYVLVQDMYDNRTLYVDRNNVNRTVETILNMHSVNLL